jgi:hypothetical protein
MAYTIEQGDIAQVVVQYAQNQVVEMYNTFHYRYTGTNPITGGADGLGRMLLDFRTSVTTLGWDALWPDTAAILVNLDKYHVQKIYPIRYARITQEVAIPGTRVGNPLPAVCQWGLTKRGEVAARYAQGGARIPGLSEDDEAEGQIAVAHRPACQALADHVRFDLVGNPGETWQPIILRRLTPGVSEVVTQSGINIDVSTQRSRRVFRGV